LHLENDFRVEVAAFVRSVAAFVRSVFDFVQSVLKSQFFDLGFWHSTQGLQLAIIDNCLSFINF